MAEINSTLTPRPDLSMAQERVHNIDFNFNAQNYLFSREPEYYVYIFNVSTQTHIVSRPPLMNKMIIPGTDSQAALVTVIDPVTKQKSEQNVTQQIEGPNGQSYRYVQATKLPQPMLTPKGNVDSNDVDFIPMDTRRFAMDVINPDNLGLDQTAQPLSTSSNTNNLGIRGVFWSLNKVPSFSEVQAAVQRMEKHYTNLLEQARTVQTSNPAALSETLTPEHHAAADYFGEETSWHGKKSRPADCPNCGARIKAGSKFHKTDEGVLCIIDWEGAVKAGVRTRAQAYEATGDAKFAPREVPTGTVVKGTVQTKPSPSVPTE